MRIGLISTLEHDEDGESLALTDFAGRTLLEWQASLAQALGCEKVICLIERLDEALLPVQHRLENAGLTFHTVRGPHQLLGIVTADDEIIAIADGLVVERDLALKVLGEGRGIAAVDVDAGLAAGFERIDAEWAWAGLLAVRGNLVERLANLPADSDAIASLLRLALQAGVPKREVDEECLADGSLMLATSHQSLLKQEKRLLDNGLEGIPPVAPGLTLASRTARYLAGRAKPVGSGGIVAIAALYLVSSGALAWYEMPVAALITFALGAFSAVVATLLDNISSRVWAEDIDPRYAAGFSIFLDIVLVALLAQPWIEPVWSLPMLGAVVLILAVRLAAAIDRAPWRWLWRDRIVLSALLALAALVGVMDEAVVAIGLAILIYILLRVPKLQLTQT